MCITDLHEITFGFDLNELYIGKYMPNKKIFDEEFGLLGCNAIKFGENPTFRRNISTPSSGLKRKLKQTAS
jgi:hypothetical protein